MRIKIYQMDPVLGGKSAITGMVIEPSELNPTAYNLVFDGDIPCDDKTELGAIFGGRSTDRCTECFHGHDLCTNDLIEVIEDDNSTFFQFEATEFTDGHLRPILAPYFSSTTFTLDARHRVFGVFAEPGKLAHIRSFDLQTNALHDLFGIGFDILRLSPNQDIAVICVGASVGSTNIAAEPALNRMLMSLDEYNVPIGPIRGPLFFCGARFAQHNERVVLHSLHPKVCAKLLAAYQMPERFYEFNTELHSVPYFPSSCVINDNEGAFK